MSAGWWSTSTPTAHHPEKRRSGRQRRLRHHRRRGEALYAQGGVDVDADGDIDADDANPFADGSRGDLVNDIAQGVGGVIQRQDGNLFGKTNVYLDGRRGEVRTEETNLGDLTADANLWYAQQTDNTVMVSIKNGGGIRDLIGRIEAVGGNGGGAAARRQPCGRQAGGRRLASSTSPTRVRFNNATLAGHADAGAAVAGAWSTRSRQPRRAPLRASSPRSAVIAFSFDATRTAQVHSSVNGG